jgi:hypothetical protein
VAQKESVEAQTPQDAQKDTLAATQIIHERWFVEILSATGCRMAVTHHGLKLTPSGILSQQP